MPSKLTTQEAIKRFAYYGYTVADSEHYHYVNSKTKTRVYDERVNHYETISLNQLMQRVRSGVRQPYVIPEISSIPISENESQPTASPFDRFIAHHHNDLNEYDDTHKQIAFNSYKQSMPLLRNMQATVDEKEMIYTITSSNSDDYSTIHACLQSPRYPMSKFMITTLTTKCAIVILEEQDYIEVNNNKYYIHNQYSDINVITLCDILNNVLASANITVGYDYCMRIVFASEEDFTITDASYNIKQVSGLFTTPLPLASINKLITVSSVGNFLSTPILYLVSDIGNSCYRTTTDKYNNQKVLMRINNSFSNNFPIIQSNAEFSITCNSNDLSNITLTLVDSNLRKIHLLSPMYISAIAQGIELSESTA